MCRNLAQNAELRIRVEIYGIRILQKKKYKTGENTTLTIKSFFGLDLIKLQSLLLFTLTIFNAKNRFFYILIY